MSFMMRVLNLHLPAASRLQNGFWHSLFSTSFIFSL